MLFQINCPNIVYQAARVQTIIVQGAVHAAFSQEVAA